MAENSADLLLRKGVFSGDSRTWFYTRGGTAREAGLIDLSGNFCSAGSGIFMDLGTTMFKLTARYFGAAIFAACMVGAEPVLAADLGLVSSGPVGNCTELVFTCENGHQYPLCPIAVSVVGEVVTASLHTGRGAARVRLVPMGVGYRYAGRGVWLDGFRENALLNFGKHVQVACTLTRS